MDDNIKLAEVIKVFKKNLVFIAFITLGSLIISAIITFFIMTPKYEASTQILVNQSQNEGDELSSTDLQSSRDLINTYNVILTSPAILEPVIENTSFDGTIEDLRSNINVTAEEESQVATITVESEEPTNAGELANTLAQTFEQEISNIMDVDNVSILSEAQSSEMPVSPKPLINLMLALIFGFLIGTSIAFLLEYLDKSLKTEQDVEKELGIPILGVVPIMASEETKRSSTENKNTRVKTKNSDKDRKTS